MWEVWKDNRLILEFKTEKEARTWAFKWLKNDYTVKHSEDLVL